MEVENVDVIGTQALQIIGALVIFFMRSRRLRTRRREPSMHVGLLRQAVVGRYWLRYQDEQTEVAGS
jgi:hypothetical protein